MDTYLHGIVNDEVGLLRPRVEEPLRGGMRWRISYCWGAHRPDDSGTGLAALPAGVLNHVPTQAAARRLARGRSSQTYFFARLVEEEDGPLLLLAEL